MTFRLDEWFLDGDWDGNVWAAHSSCPKAVTQVFTADDLITVMMEHKCEGVTRDYVDETQVSQQKESRAL